MAYYSSGYTIETIAEIRQAIVLYSKLPVYVTFNGRHNAYSVKANRKDLLDVLGYTTDDDKFYMNVTENGLHLHSV